MAGFGLMVGVVVGGVGPSSIGTLEPAAGLGEWAESDGRIAWVTAAYRPTITYTPDPSPSPGPQVGCEFFSDLGPLLGESLSFGWADAVEHAELLGLGEWYSVQIRCWVAGSPTLLPGFPRFFDPPQPPFPPAPDVVEAPRLEIYAHRALQFEQAVAELSPPVDQFVGVPTWLAVTSEREYAPITANAGPLWATVRPEFRNVRWDMGDGSPPIVCEGEEVAVVFDPGVPADEQSPGCVHVYEANGAGAVVPMTITATMTWDIWASTSSRPTERLITPVTRQTTFVVDVRELQAVID